MNTATDRRGFLRASLASLATGAVSPSALEAASNSGLKIGVASYSLRKFTRPQAIAILQRLKVNYISIKEFHLHYTDSPEQIAAGAREFRDAGIAVLSGGAIELDDPKLLRARFEYAKAAGMPEIVCAPAHSTLAEIEKLVQEFDIKAAIHNHGPEDKKFPTPESVLSAIKGMDPRVGLCMDIGHTARTGADILDEIRKAGPRLLDMHAKDLRDKLVSKSLCPVGEGVLPIVEMFKLLRKMNYQGGVMLEYEIEADDPAVGMAKSLGYMRGIDAAL